MSNISYKTNYRAIYCTKEMYILYIYTYMYLYKFSKWHKNQFELLAI